MDWWMDGCVGVIDEQIEGDGLMDGQIRWVDRVGWDGLIEVMDGWMWDSWKDGWIGGQGRWIDGWGIQDVGLGRDGDWEQYRIYMGETKDWWSKINAEE